MRTPDGQPLLALDRVGQGRTALLLSDQIWLWSRGHEGGGPQAELLRRIAHWLMQEPDLEENALTARVADGRLRIESRSTDPGPPADVVVTDPDGKKETVKLHEDSPGRATAVRVAPVPGVWQVTQGHAVGLCRGRGSQSAGTGRSAGDGKRRRAAWRGRRAAGCTGWPGPRCRSCGGPRKTGRRPAVPGSACSGGTIMW